VQRILKEERDIVIASRPLQATGFQIDNDRIAYDFYESGLSINVMYTVDDPDEQRLGSSSLTGWTSPAELASRFKFATGSRNWREPFAVRTSPSRTSTDPGRLCETTDSVRTGRHAA
jgi:hypothetical protein